MYVADLGLIGYEGKGRGKIANEIYREVIPRYLTSVLQMCLEKSTKDNAYHSPEGRLSLHELLKGFQQYYRKNDGVLSKRTQYEEAARELLLQLWLHRFVNGSGSIRRQYALGRGRVDLMVLNNYEQNGRRSVQRFLVKIKVVHAKWSVETTVAKGLIQIAKYGTVCHAEEVHLVVFNPKEKDWEKRIYVKECVENGKTVMVWGV